MSRSARKHCSLRFVVESLEERLVLSADLFGPLGTLAPLADDTPAMLSASANSTQGAAYNLPQTHDQYSYRGKGYTVAVIDSGIDYQHPALGGGYGPNYRVIGGWDFVDGRDGSWNEGDLSPGPDADPMDAYGHGTMISGIIGAQDDIYPGVAPEVNLVGLRVLDANGNGDLKWLKDALEWVVHHREEYNIVAVNMSVGVGNYSRVPATDQLAPLLQSLTDDGVFITAASGNNYYSLGSRPGLAYPAVSPNVVSVGAVYDWEYGLYNWPDGAKDYSTGIDRVASFGQRSENLDLMTPGAIVTSTQLSHGGNENYGTYFGTSLASAIASGASVLAREAAEAVGRPDLVHQDRMLDIFQSTGVTVIDGDDEMDNVTNTGLSFKRLDLLAAISHIESLGTQAPDHEELGPKGGIPSTGEPNLGSGSTGGNHVPDKEPTPPPPSQEPDHFESTEISVNSGKLELVTDAVFESFALNNIGVAGWYMPSERQHEYYSRELDTPAEKKTEPTVRKVSIREIIISDTVAEDTESMDVHQRIDSSELIEMSTEEEVILPAELSLMPEQQAETESDPEQKQHPSKSHDRVETNHEKSRPESDSKISSKKLGDLTLHFAEDIDYFLFQSESRRHKIEQEIVNGGSAMFTLIDVGSQGARSLPADQPPTGADREVNLRDRVH